MEEGMTGNKGLYHIKPESLKYLKERSLKIIFLNTLR